MKISKTLLIVPAVISAVLVIPRQSRADSEPVNVDPINCWFTPAPPLTPEQWTGLFEGGGIPQPSDQDPCIAAAQKAQHKKIGEKSAAVAADLQAKGMRNIVIMPGSVQVKGPFKSKSVKKKKGTLYYSIQGSGGVTYDRPGPFSILGTH